MRQQRLVAGGALLAAALLVACGGVDPVNDLPAQAEVQARFDAWVKAWNATRPAGLEPFYVQKDHLTVLWPTGERTRGWAQERELQQRFLPGVSLMNLAPQKPTITLVRPNLALVTFPFNLDVTYGGTRQVGPGEGTMLWQQEEGAWRIYAAQLSYKKVTEAQLSAPLQRPGIRP